jgi:cyclopropane fatty-acyl-phospholipid synthase-like methyltransferase
MTEIPYEKQTVDNPNPIARFAHRSRMRRSRRLVMPFLKGSARLLDYGCGQGRFLHDLANEINGQQSQVTLRGYDPYQSAQFDGYRITSDPAEIAPASVDILTSLEVCEHLTGPETDEFVEFAVKVLPREGRLLVSVPIEIGPSVLAKEASRSILHRRRPDLSASELFRAAFVGTPPRRAEDVKDSHRGYDWRVTHRRLLENFSCDHIEFSPLPFNSWYGQSQVIMLFRKP